jgi:hypothetical protein
MDNYELIGWSFLVSLFKKALACVKKLSRMDVRRIAAV